MGASSVPTPHLPVTTDTGRLRYDPPPDYKGLLHRTSRCRPTGEPRRRCLPLGSGHADHFVPVVLVRVRG